MRRSRREALFPGKEEEPRMVVEEEEKAEEEEEEAEADVQEASILSFSRQESS